MMKFSLLILILGLTIIQVESNCIWYGECGNSMNDGKYNCEYSGPALPLENDPELHELYKSICPHLYQGNETKTCCDRAQLKRINDNLSLPKQLMNRCPACYTNFKAFLCDLTCHPESSDFLLVTDESVYNTTEKQITTLTYHMSTYYAQNMYDSCK